MSRLFSAILAKRLAVTALCVFIALPAYADPGVSADKIVFGQAAALDGPASALGTGMRDGLLAAFDEINQSGGINGRKLELISKDDGYEPEKSAAAVKSLINDDKVFAIVGAVGTPTSKVTQPIAAESGVPFIGPFTGAAVLRKPEAGNVINLRASYNQETENLVEHLTTDLGAKKIAIFYQDDDYGMAGLNGVKAALEKRGMKLAGEGVYQRNTIAVKSGLLNIREADPDAVILIGTYSACAEFIKLAKQLNLKAAFANISFVGTEALVAALGPAGSGVIISEILPLPTKTSVALVGDYQKALSTYVKGAKPSYVSLEGYAVGILVGEILKKISGEPTREAFMKTALNSDFDLGGFKFHYGANHQGSDALFLTVIQPDGTLKQVDKLSK